MSTTVMPVYASSLDAVLTKGEALSAHGPEWLRTLRRRALAAHREQGVPTPKNEEWKYTPLRSLAQTPWRPGEPGPAVFDQELRWLAEGARIVVVNGRFDRNLSHVPTAAGLSATSLYNALQESPELVGQYLGGIAPVAAHTFAALNTAVFEDGVFLHLRANAEVETPIEIVHVSTGEGMVLAPRLLIVAEEGARVQVVESYVTDGGGVNLTVPVTEVFVGRGARIEHVRVQDEHTANHHIALWQVNQAGGSDYRSYNVAFGAGLARADQNIFLDGEHIVTRLDGVVVATGDQLIDNHTRLDHAKPNCNSFEVYKQIIGGRGTIVFNGKIFVHQDAQKTDAKQTNQALLLSPTATINSKPQLEIFADDVKCTHGATVGQIEDAPLFYLRSRGITEAEARGLLVYAFAAEVLELISDRGIVERLEARLFEKLRD